MNPRPSWSRLDTSGEDVDAVNVEPLATNIFASVPNAVYTELVNEDNPILPAVKSSNGYPASVVPSSLVSPYVVRYVASLSAAY